MRGLVQTSLITLSHCLLENHDFTQYRLLYLLVSYIKIAQCKQEKKNPIKIERMKRMERREGI